MTDIVLRIQSAVGAAVADVSKFRDSIATTEITAKDLRDTWRATTAEIIEDTQKQVAAQKEKVDQYRAEIAAIQDLTATYKRGSDERRIATQMEIDLQRKLQAALGETAAASTKAAKRSSEAADASGLARGAASRSGVIGAGLSALAGPGFLVGAVVGGTVDAGVKAAEQEQVAQANLRNALRDVGEARQVSKKQLEDYVATEEKATGFDRGTVIQTMSQLIRSTGDYRKAQQDEAVMADIARARHTDLNGAMMLVLRASEGNVGSLKRLGIEIPKVTTYEDQLKEAHIKGNLELTKRAKALDLAATKSEVMRAVTQKFAGDSTAYMKTFGGETATLSNTWRDLEVEIGQKAIPKLTELFGWTEKEIAALKANKGAQNDFKEALKAVETVIGDVDKVTGGFVHTLELLAAWWATGKVIDYANTVKKTITSAYEGAAAAVNNFRKVNAESDAAVVASSEEAGAAVDAAFPWAIIIQAAVLATIEIIQHWGTVKKWFLEFWGWMKDTGRAAWALVIDLAKAAVYAMLNYATAGIQAILEVASHLPFVGHKAKAALDDIQSFISKWKPDFSNVVSAFNAGGAAAGSAFEDQIRKAAEQSGQTIQQATVGAYHHPGDTTGGAAYTPSGANAVQKGLVATAQSALGNPYQYGGAPSISSPTDCSGLMVAVFSQHGIQLPRTSEEQFANAPIKNARPLAPGDLVFAEGIHPGHVGLYIGDNQVLEDPHTGDHVKIVPLDGFGWNGESARWWAKNAKPITGGGGSSKPASTATNSSFDAAVQQASAAAAAAKQAKSGVKAPTLTGIEGQITAELKDLPKNLDPVEKEAVKHIEAIKASLHVGMSQEELAKDRVALASWGTSLKKEIAKNAKAATDAAKQHAKEVKDAARAAAQAWADGWQVDVTKIDRAISEQWSKVQQVFDRETQAHVTQMQRDFAAQMTTFDRETQAHLTGMQRAFQAQMTQFDRDTQTGLDALVVQQTPAEKALADFQAQRAAQQLATTQAQQQSDLAAAIATGDPAQIKQAQDAINTTLADQQEAALQAAADASRKAADTQTAQQQQSYQDQRDAQKQSLQDQEDALEQHYSDQRDATKQGLQDQETLLEQSYTDQRSTQWQHLQDMHDDQVTAFDADLKLWQTWLSTKQKTWAQFIAWLGGQAPTTGIINVTGFGIDDPTNFKNSVGGTQAPNVTTTPTVSRTGPAKAFAAGTIAWRPTVGMIGDQGPEAVFPLTGQRGQETIRMLAEAIAQAGGRGGGGTTIYGTFLGATEKQVGNALERLVTPEQARTTRYSVPI